MVESESPGNHLKCHVLEAVHRHGPWDLLVAHPPCTYLSNMGAAHLHRNGRIDEARAWRGWDARALFESLLHCGVQHVCVENPRPLAYFNLPTESQAIQPFQFGEPYTKRTHLWLVNLPRLSPTVVLWPSEVRPWLPSNTGGKARGQKATKGVAATHRDRSRTFAGVAAAMASQWGAFIESNSNREIAHT